MDYFAEVPERVYPVGRLDYDTSGLLLLTNDGELSQTLMHPKHEVEKVYVAKVKGIADKKQLLPLTKGIRIEGRKTAPARFEILSTDQTAQSSIVQLTIHEGRNHQVKTRQKQLVCLCKTKTGKLWSVRFKKVFVQGNTESCRRKKSAS